MIFLKMLIHSCSFRLCTSKYGFRVLNSNCTSKIFFSSQSEPNAESENKASKDDSWFNVETSVDIDERVVPKPISYLPDHVPQNRKRIRQRPWWKYRYFVDVHTLPLEQEEYTEKPEYPPIYDPSNEGIQKKIRLEWYDAIRRLPSAQQKIYEITKHYSHLSYLLEPVMKPYNFLPTQKYITRTHLIDGLPENSLPKTEMEESLQNQIVSLIESRLFSTKSRKSSYDMKKTSLPTLGFSKKDNVIQSYKEEDILVDVMNLIRNNKFQTQKLNIHVDYNPFVGVSWWVGNFPIPFKKQKWFKKNEFFNQCFTYHGNHNCHVRIESPLSKIVPMDDDLCRTEIPKWDHNLLSLGIPLKRKNILSLPGFWPGQSSGFDFPYLLGLNRENLRHRRTLLMSNCQDDQDVLDGMAITSAFCWLMSSANNLGFTIYDRLTYPLVTNVIITDGQFWSFYIYQLNNHCFHEDLFEESFPCNLCWSSGDMKLFDMNEQGIITNINQNVLNYLIKFLTMEPEKDVDYNLRPYLSTDDRAKQDKDELNYSLRRKFANQTDPFVASHKKVNLWEKIYKNHKDAVMDLKRVRPKINQKYPPFFK